MPSFIEVPKYFLNKEKHVQENPKKSVKFQRTPNPFIRIFQTQKDLHKQKRLVIS